MKNVYILTAAEVCKAHRLQQDRHQQLVQAGAHQVFRKNNVNHIPKVYLVEFFCSIYFRTITRKSDWHIWTLKLFPAWRRQKEM